MRNGVVATGPTRQGEWEGKTVSAADGAGGEPTDHGENPTAGGFDDDSPPGSTRFPGID
jgi:hypothetical protein